MLAKKVKVERKFLKIFFRKVEAKGKIAFRWFIQRWWQYV